MQNQMNAFVSRIMPGTARFAVKDNICTKSTTTPTTCASKTLVNYKSPFDATIVHRLGANLVAGKTNMDEFGMGSGSVHSVFGPVLNPLDQEFSAGGSSGGSAAAVAAGMVNVALGSDTGGSVRLPAAYCGVVGFKPTYGRLSRYGLVSYASSMDCPGIIARDIDTVKDVLGKCEGYDPKDPTSLKSIEFEKRSGRPVIGIPVEFNVDGISEQVRSAWSGAAVELLEQGFDVVQVSIPSVEHSLAVYYIIAAAEASSNLSRYTGLFYGHNALNQESFKDLHQFIAKNRTESFGKEVKRRILTGTFVLSSKAYQSYFEKAQKIRKIIYRDFQLAFQKCDFLLTPTCPSSAVPLNGILNPQDPTQEYAQDVMTVPANLVGIPAISIPRKAGNSSLPIGLQLMGKRKSDYELLKLARMLVH